MFEEVIELSRMAEDMGVEAITFPEHHLHTEGLEVGSLPTLYQYVIHHTRHIKVGPIGYVLPGWNPLRLALEIAWLDQLTKGRTFCGFARGYQTRWLNQMAQKIHVSATTSDKSAIDQVNREAFEEVFQILKLAWGDKPFRFKGKYYEYPYPYEEGTPWLPHQWTREFGAPGEVDENGRIQMIDEAKYPAAKGLLPQSEWTVDRMIKSHYLLAGTRDDVRREMDALVEAANPEWFCWFVDQGLFPLYEVKKQLEFFGSKILPQYK